MFVELFLSSAHAHGWVAFSQGLALGLGLIVAIGAQNAFVLRQGLRREHIHHVVLLCALVDAMLISAGVFGMAKTLGDQPLLVRSLAWFGAVFLAWYGTQAMLRTRHPRPLDVHPAKGTTQWTRVVLQALAFTFLNPHVYLDTVLLVGSVGAQQTAALQPWFVAGACLASLGWFSLLGFGARWLAPWFARPRAWQVLDGLIGLTMWVLSASMIHHALTA